MPVITSIKPQKIGKRVNIFLDYKFGFGLDLQTFIKEGLKVEQELTDKQIETIVKQGEFQSTYDKILRFATIRPRSEKEFEIWTVKHKIHESLKLELFNRLKRLELLDDKKFSKWWIEQRLEFRPKSKRILNQELRIKGVKQDVINEVLAEEKVDERTTAKRMLAKKKHVWDRLTGFEKRKKMFNFLMQKGFNSDVIRDVLQNFTEDGD